MTYITGGKDLLTLKLIKTHTCILYMVWEFDGFLFRISYIFIIQIQTSSTLHIDVVMCHYQNSTYIMSNLLSLKCVTNFFIQQGIGVYSLLLIIVCCFFIDQIIICCSMFGQPYRRASVQKTLLHNQSWLAAF